MNLKLETYPVENDSIKDIIYQIGLIQDKDVYRRTKPWSYDTYQFLYTKFRVYLGEFKSF